MAQKNYISITYADIGTIFPPGYIEKIYLEDNRIAKNGHFYEEFKSSEKHQTVFDTFYKSHVIQALVYDKYKFSFIKTENYDVEMLQFAQEITAYDLDTKLYFTPQVISIDVKKKYGWDIVTVEFYDINTENYPSGVPIINNFRNDIIKTKYTGWQLAKLTKTTIFANGRSSFYYGMIPTKTIEGKPELVQQIEIEGKKWTVGTTTKTKEQVIIYVNDNDLQFLQNQVASGTVTILYDSVTYTGIENGEIDVQDISGSVDLHKVTLSITTEIANDYQFRSDKLATGWVAKLNIHIDGSDYYFYSKIPVVEIESEVENAQESELNGKTITTRNTTKTKQEIIFFMNDEDLQEFVNLSAKCGKQSTIFLESNTGTVSNKERPEMEITRQSQFNKVIFRFASIINNNLIYA